MPRYLNFVRGVVDSDDLPLNVSREQLQQLKMIKVISKKLVRKTLDMIRKMAEEEQEEEEEEDEYDDSEEGTEEGAEDAEDEKEEKEETSEEGEKKEGEDGEKKEEETKEDDSDYGKFWKSFGKNIKLGVIEDAANRSKLAKLLRFASTKSEDELTSLDEYIGRMKDNQDSIYYLPGDSKDSIMKSPLLGKFQKADIEVLILADPIDEFCMQHLSEYDKRKVKSIAKEDGNAFINDEE